MSTRVSWIDELEASVPSGSLTKGRKYFHSGAVRIDFAGAERVRAAVLADGRHSVALAADLKARALVGSCTCSHYESKNICKHIWAAVLAAESKGHLKELEKISGATLKTEIDSKPAHGRQEKDRSSMHPSRPATCPPSRPPAPAEPPKWRQHQEGLRLRKDAPAAAPAPSMEKRVVLYVADVQRSLSAGALVIHAGVSRQKKDGTWTTLSFDESARLKIADLDAADRKILSLLSGAKEINSYYGSREESVRSVHRLSAGAEDVLIRMLCQTGRLLIKPSATARTLSVLKWDPGAPWSFGIHVRRIEDRAEYAVEGVLVRSRKQAPISEPILLMNGLAFFNECVSRFEDGGAVRWVTLLRSEGSLTMSFEQYRDLINEMTQLAVLPSMQVPEELRIEEQRLVNPPELKIRPLQESWRYKPMLCASVVFDYDGVKIPQTEMKPAFYDRTRKRFVRRDLQAELARLNRLPELGFWPTGSWQSHRWELPPSRLAEAVSTLVSEGWQIDAEGKVYRRAGKFQMSVVSGVDWFELRGKAYFEGCSVAIPELLKAIARDEHAVRLGDGTYGLVPDEWLTRYKLVAAMGSSGGGQMRFQLHHAGLLDAVLAEQQEVEYDEGFTRMRQELSDFGGVAGFEAAATFNGKLRDYQRDGLGWLQFLRKFRFGGCLADDMGLGKTVQVLALLDSLQSSRPCLIVAPRSLIFNWQQEAERFAPRLRVLDYTGIDRTKRVQDFEQSDLILTTYGTLRRDVLHLREFHFDTIVLDEAQAIKNASTESAKAARLLNADHRLALTGTPVENRLSDLWSLFEFLNPGLLGTASVFRRQATTRNDEAGAGNPDQFEASLRMLSKALRPFLMRRTKDQVARELPPKTEQTIYCELDSEQRRLYNELRAHYRDALLGRINDVGIDKSRMHILEALLRLRQAACHPGLIDKERAGHSSAKLDCLIPQISELIEGGRKAIVFSQFTSFLQIVRKRLDNEQLAYEYLDGKTRDRQDRVRRFQEDDSCRLFLISLKAGGLGLNLTAAEYVFLLDPWWNPAIEAQAIDRSHRIGQTRNVFAYRLIARDTVEEKILELQRTKRELADAIITSDNGVLATLNRENLGLLLS